MSSTCDVCGYPLNTGGVCPRRFDLVWHPSASPTVGQVCAHGSLARSCERCEDAAEIARLRQERNDALDREAKAVTGRIFAERERDEARAALRKVMAHTGFLPSADRLLLEGLLASIKRVASAALEEGA